MCGTWIRLRTEGRYLSLQVCIYIITTRILLYYHMVNNDTVLFSSCRKGYDKQKDSLLSELILETAPQL